MKRLHLIGFGIALGLLIFAAGVVLWLQQRRVGGYAVEGRVAGFSDDPRTLIVEHEEIPGYMPAMTMPFTAARASELEGVRRGDAIGFRLYTREDSSWITEVERLPDSSVARHPAAATSLRYTQSSDRRALQRGDEVPDFTLSQDQNGEPVRLSDYEGEALLLTFIYTRCPIPDYCPLMSKNFAQLQERIPPGLEDQVELLSVSFDPEHDTPQVLRDYAQRYTDDLSNWTFATGTSQEVQRVVDLFGVFTEQQQGQIVHNLRTVLIGPEGRVRETWRGNDWEPRQVLEEVRRVVSGGAGGD